MSPTRLLALVLVIAGALTAGCKGNCQQLSEKLCYCTSNTALQASCIQRAATEASNIGSTPVDEQRCAALMNNCDCHIINTPAGKVACGLARAAPDGGVP